MHKFPLVLKVVAVLLALAFTDVHASWITVEREELSERQSSISASLHRQLDEGTRFIDYLNFSINRLKNQDPSGSLVATQAVYKLLLKAWIEPAALETEAPLLIQQIWSAREETLTKTPDCLAILKNTPDFFKNSADNCESNINVLRNNALAYSQPAARESYYLVMLVGFMQRDVALVAQALLAEPQYNDFLKLAVTAFFELKSFTNRWQSQETACFFKRLPEDQPFLDGPSLPLPQLLDKLLHPQDNSDQVSSPATSNNHNVIMDELTRFNEDFAKLRLQGNNDLTKRLDHLLTPLLALQTEGSLKEQGIFPFNNTVLFLHAFRAYLPSNKKEPFSAALQAAAPASSQNLTIKPDDLQVYAKKLKEIHHKIGVLKKELSSNNLTVKNSDELSSELFIDILFHNILWFTQDFYMHQDTMGQSSYQLGLSAVKGLEPYVNQEKRIFIPLSPELKSILKLERLHNSTH